METKFQTSFIPRKPLVTDQKIHTGGGTSVFMVIATIIFIVSLSGAGFTIIWKNLLMKAQTQYMTDLDDRQKRFNIDLIESLKKANTKIDDANSLLANHLAVSEVFDIISKLTIQGVRFTSLEFLPPDPTVQNAAAKISMKGVANSYSSIAYQSDVFGSSQKFGTNKVLKNPILSDLSVDDKGNVGFTFTADIAPADISYAKVLNDTLQAEGLIPASASTTPDTSANTNPAATLPTGN